MAYKDILKLVPMMQSTALVSSNIPKKNKKFTPAKTALKNILGIELIKTTGNIIGWTTTSDPQLKALF